MYIYIIVIPVFSPSTTPSSSPSSFNQDASIWKDNLIIYNKNKCTRFDQKWQEKMRSKGGKRQA